MEKKTKALACLLYTSSLARPVHFICDEFANVGRLPDIEHVVSVIRSRNVYMSIIDVYKRQRVSCVIVKDLSRFAREYIDAGTYIEQVFPFLRVRFVSIAEAVSYTHLDVYKRQHQSGRADLIQLRVCFDCPRTHRHRQGMLVRA